MIRLISRFRSRAHWAAALAAASWVSACSLEERTPPPLRAHTRNHQGAFHAEPLDDAAHYCRECHGTGLAGGKNGEPSCLQCHGENWPQRNPDETDAPADHTTLQGLFRHHPDLLDAPQTCAVSGCHGADLTGDLSVGAPSCFLCHDKRWR